MIWLISKPMIVNKTLRKEVNRMFGKLKKIYENKWSQAHKAEPKVYQTPDSGMMGAMAITEGVDTIFPKNPKALFKVDGAIINEWQMAVVSTTKDSVLYSDDYYKVLKLLKSYVVEENDNYLLIRGLSLDELLNLE